MAGFGRLYLCLLSLGHHSQATQIPECILQDGKDAGATFQVVSPGIFMSSAIQVLKNNDFHFHVTLIIASFIAESSRFSEDIPSTFFLLLQPLSGTT